MSELTKQQLEVINHDSGNILVSASAGSGKTHTMIERIKRLIIECGVSLSSILAVTFTETAAADMKDKLRKALSEVIVQKRYTKKQKEFCKEQLQELYTADICTMHAFCGRLIRTYFFSVGVSPDFKILDQADANVLRILAVEKTFKEFYDRGEDWFLTLVDRHAYGRMDTKLKQLILSAYAFCDSEAYPSQLKCKYKEVYSEDGLRKLLDRYKEKFKSRVRVIVDELNIALSIFENENFPKAAEFTATLIKDIEKLLASNDVYDVKKYKGYKLAASFERGLSDEAKKQKELAMAARDKFIKLIERFDKCLGDNFADDFVRFESCRTHTENIVKIIDRFSQIYAQDKLDENALDFNDLEHFALKILSDEQLIDSIKNKYKHIFIDEYQDTNGVQEEIISKIGLDNVFMVGDVKQSIYGFRGCRSEFFLEKDKNMTENGQKVVRLNHNFRSADNVINTVNQIFNFCMTKDVYGESYEEKSQLISGGIYPEGEAYKGRASLHFLKKEDKDKKTAMEGVYDLLYENAENEEDEIKTLSALIANLIMQERANIVYDTKKKKLRAVEFGDITILTRNRNGKYVSDLVSGLIQNNIPVSSDVKENVCDYPEIKVMINALKLIDCFLQDLPLVSTLKSAIGGFTEEELFEIVRYYDDNAQDKHGSFCDAYEFYVKNSSTELKTKLVKFESYFDKIRVLADFNGAHGAMNKLIADSNMEAYLYANPLGADMVNRLRRFVSASVINGKILTVREFLLRIETCPDAFGLSPFASENTVKVMTIHASKGLEFPVVITCGLERSFNTEEDYENLMFSRNYGFAVMYYDDALRTKSETLLRGIIREENREQRIKEEMRLFYVATTRATNSLHMTFWAKDDNRKKVFNGADKFIDFIPEQMPAINHDKQELLVGRKRKERQKVIIVKDDAVITAKMKENFDFSYKFLSDCFLPLKASVTSVSKTEVVDEDYHLEISLFEEDGTDKESGIIAHKILELYDFNSNISLAEQVEMLVKQGEICDKDVQKVNLSRLQKALNSDVFNRLKNKELFREKAFLINVPAKNILSTESSQPVLVQGIIDLLVIDGEFAEIIDYKYSALNDNRLKETYKKQIELYAYAVEKVLGKKITHKTLVNIFSGSVIEL